MVVAFGLAAQTIAAGSDDFTGREIEAIRTRLGMATSSEDDWTDDHWAEGFHLPDLNGPVYAMAVLDGRLYVGGLFSRAGAVEAKNIASWDGESWSALGSGAFDERSYAQVTALLVKDGELFVGGLFDNAGGWRVHGVARWDGQAWHPLGEGPGERFAFSNVNDLEIYNGKVAAGGVFTTGNDRFGIALWDGARWELEGSLSAGSAQVNGLASFNGSLVAGGMFESLGNVGAHNVAQWNGVAWSPLDTGLDGEIASLSVYELDLVAAGYTSSSEAVMARWNGATWTAFEAGLEGSWVYSTDVLDGELWAGLVNGVAQWDGQKWTRLPTALEWQVYSLASFDGALHVGGDFRLADGPPAFNVARWTGKSWVSPLGSGQGINGGVSALASFNGDLIAGGYFATAGRVSAFSIARWDGESWSSLNPVPPPYAESISIYELAVYRDELVAAGSFRHIGGVPAANIAGWDGKAWHPLGSGLPDATSLLVHDGRLVAGGYGQHPVMAWDGTSWLPMDSGVDGYVTALGEFRKDLVAAVYRQGREDSAFVARLEGQVWVPLPGVFTDEGPNVFIRSMIPYGDSLIVSGEFDLIEGQQVNGIAAWNGVSWHPLAGTDRHVSRASSAMAVYDDRLVISNDGGFTSKEPQTWDGGRWKSLGSGLRSTASSSSVGSAGALAVQDGHLFVGGWFSMAGNKAADNITHWSHVDLTAPTMTVGIVQNPYLTENLSLYMIGTESLARSSMDFSVGGEPVAISLVDAAESLWRAPYRLSGSTDSLAIRACAADVSGNDSCVVVTFAAGRVTSAVGGTIRSVDHRAALIVDAGASERDAYILALPGNAMAGSDAEGFWYGPLEAPAGDMTAYTFSSSRFRLLRSARIEMHYGEHDEDVDPDRVYIELVGVGPLESFVDPARMVVSAPLSQLGTFRLVTGTAGSSRRRQAAFLRLEANYPNPARPATTIAFEVHERQRTRITIYDVTGRRITTLFNDLVAPGVTEISWDGRSDRGGIVPNGVYFYSVETDHARASRKLHVAK